MTSSKRFSSVADLLRHGSHLLDAHPNGGPAWEACARVEHDGLVWKVARTARSADLERVADGHPTDERSPNPGNNTILLYLVGRMIPMRAQPEHRWGTFTAGRPMPMSEVNARQGGVVEAASALLARYGPQSRRDLLRLLSRQYRCPLAAVLQALQTDPQFIVATDVISIHPVPPPHPIRRAGHLPPGAIPNAAPVSDLVYALSLVDTDEVLLRCDASTGNPQIRCDSVRSGHGGQIWVTAKVTGQDLYDRLVAIDGAQTLGPDLRLPLRPPPTTPPALPTALVWCEASATTAEATVTQIQTAWVSGEGGWRIERVSCSPAELERRIDGERTIRRLRARAAPGPPVRTCDRCGHPLSDPQSVALGIGPECRKHYTPEVLAAAAHRGRSSPAKLGSRAPRQWARVVRAWLQDEDLG